MSNPKHSNRNLISLMVELLLQKSNTGLVTHWGELDNKQSSEVARRNNCEYAVMQFLEEIQKEEKPSILRADQALTECLSLLKGIFVNVPEMNAQQTDAFLRVIRNGEAVLEGLDKDIPRGT